MSAEQPTAIAHAACPRGRLRDDGLVLVCEGADNAPRWRPGQRLEQLFQARCAGPGSEQIAVETGERTVSYSELDAGANRLAHHLRASGTVAAGDRVGLLLEDPLDLYTAILAALKLGAAYVPLDPGAPADRTDFITQDAGLAAVLTGSALRAAAAAACPDAPVDPPSAPSDVCYVIYTSGTTGRPKGVEISHAAICNFVQVAAESYGLRPGDRVYQGLTPVFDFWVEETWVPWLSGATLVPKPPGASLLGRELHEFLRERSVSALCCVPTLLQTLAEDLPDLRLLLVSGESCPRDLVARWHRSDRRLLNVYGPTEATVSATWALLDPEQPVRIGAPLPSYAVAILDPERDRALGQGACGELAIGGIGLAEGYVGLPERTAESFVEDFLGIEHNPSGRLYRTGDLARICEDGQIEHLGRIDTQVKIRGFRIELEEIEAVLREAPGVTEAAVGVHRAGGEDELVAYVTAAAQRADPAEIRRALAQALPRYMVPAYVEQLAALPLMPSGKVDRRALPPPAGGRRGAGSGEHVAADSELERGLAVALGRVLEFDEPSVESDFFADLGASSLTMARFVAELRSADLPAPSMQEIYRHPTIRELARELEGGRQDEVPAFQAPDPPAPEGVPRPLLCGTLQLLATLAYVIVAGLLFVRGIAWLTSADGIGAIYARSVAVAAATLLATGCVPIAAKWLLIGRWRRRALRIWSLPYVRFWIVKTLVAANPTARLLRGTPLAVLYLRALGARVASDALILTRHLPICTDLITIGAQATISRDTHLGGYRASGGAIEIGPVSVGDGAFVGALSVLDVETSIGDLGQLGHASALHAGQAVPAGACWHGVPARPAEPDCDYDAVPPDPLRPLRRAAYALMRLLFVVLILGPIEVAAVGLLIAHPRVIGDLSDADSPLIAAATIATLLLAGLAIGALVPRLCTLALRPGRSYPVWGWRFALQRIAARCSNLPSLTLLTGDSVLIVHYLRLLGYRFPQLQQTGTNFGTAVRHELPTKIEIGRGTLVSDGLTLLNAEFSNSSFRVMPIRVGARSFLGNALLWPPGARVGENCLIATRTMLPLTGPVRSDTGLLGSPPFEIPRTVTRDERVPRPADLGERVRAKTRHNLATIGLHVLVRFVYLSLVLLSALLPDGGAPGLLATAVLDLGILPVLVFGLLERLCFRALRPRLCSIYDAAFWGHERYWKVPSVVFLRTFDGTPFKPLVWRLLGVRIGRRVFDDGCAITERTLTEIGDDTVLNAGTVIQAHSLEDGAFKSDRVRVGSGCTLGVDAFVHYGASTGDHVTVDPGAFVMKGSQPVEGSRWRGNPAAEVRSR